MKIKLGLCFLICSLMQSCASKKDVWYMQDASTKAQGEINYTSASIQPNDILKITVESTVPEAAFPYNQNSFQGTTPQNLQAIQLNGYLVSLSQTITFPVLGKIPTKGKTTQELAALITNRLVSEGHLSDPTVAVRLLNAKFTVLGEVQRPGTYTFTEQNITILQALGYAGDLTITGKREDILITREVNGLREVSHIDLTASEFMNSPYYFIKPNDVIVVNPNKPRVMNSGFIGSTGTILTIASLLLSVAVLLSR